VRRLVPPSLVAQLLRPEHEGISFSGGEPFLQASALALLAREVRRSGRSVVSYSGFTLQELQSGEVPDAAALLSELDILIDGPFVPAQAATLPWRGSSNQQIHFLTDRYGPQDLSHAVSADLLLGPTTAQAAAVPNAALRTLLAGVERAGWKMRPVPPKPRTIGQTQVPVHASNTCINN
jgi:organic radical activating enzyme